MELKEWQLTCKRCGVKGDTVQMSSLSIGDKVVMVCKDCSKKLASLQPLMIQWVTNWLKELA